MSRPRIGSLRHRIVIEAPVRTADGGGGASVAWSPVAEVWARIKPLGGSERVLAEAVSGRITHSIVVRHRDDVVPAWRLRRGTRHFEILAVLDPDERRHFLECLCREDVL